MNPRIGWAVVAVVALAAVAIFGYRLANRPETSSIVVSTVQAAQSGPPDATTEPVFADPAPGVATAVV